MPLFILTGCLLRTEGTLFEKRERVKMTKSDMTKSDMSTKKLSLRRESLRELTTADLEKVAGGHSGTSELCYKSSTTY